MDYIHVWLGPGENLPDDWLHIADPIVDCPIEDIRPETYVYHSSRKNYPTLIDLVLAAQHPGANVRYSFGDELIDFKCTVYGNPSSMNYKGTHGDARMYRLLELQHSFYETQLKVRANGLPVIYKNLEWMHSPGASMPLILYARRFLKCSHDQPHYCFMELAGYREAVYAGLAKSWDDSHN